LTWPIAVASLQILISATSIVPSSLATQDLSFRNLSKIEMAAGVVNVAVTLLLALAGSGVWALVIGALVGAVTRSAALLATGERVAPLFSLRGIGEPLKFGLTVVSNRVTYFIVVQSDILIGSAFLSTNEIGQYAVALQLATLPLTKVMGIINQIALPAVAQQQTDPLRVRQSVQKASGLISLLAFPALWGISAVAPELVEVLFGGKWSEAVPALVILPLVMPLRMICGILFTASLAMGNRQLDLRNTVINLIVLPLGFFIGAHWGLVGLCLSWLVSVPLAYVFTIPGILQRIGIRPRDFVFESGAPALAAAAMYGSVAALRLMTERWPAIAALFVLSLAGACAYFLVMGLISRRHLAAAASFTRAFLRRDAPTSV
jgi:teichuronic acid exporter